ncbi:hypothetical protein K493DRAFT_300925 [Basidiobolus meristosporus CBS 931.73]|uniref:PX domain-containing protein n=1 Tax=Basidiobolus meristosporus CBS 931.73 TaxID=1314790 RepID=A0A1Y1YEG8_9FUNG|nr:hypothetical protein K493DRAFT_300925 [Basidiobolus meristosporus CBS 931.73]|eukprot:ORX96402.1 hypothetical protein K493DRAFT_300925 [Basidiobolus meristosporus CBS 931.73]
MSDIHPDSCLHAYSSAPQEQQPTSLYVDSSYLPRPHVSPTYRLKILKPGKGLYRRIILSHEGGIWNRQEQIMRMENICFVFGYLYAIPSNAILSSPLLSKFDIFCSNSAEVEEKLVPPSQLAISPQIDSSLKRLFDYIVRDFVHYWFDPLNISGNMEFESNVRNSLSTAASNFSSYARRDNVDLSLLLIYAIANTTIVHVREYRFFEASALSLDKYLVENPQSPFNQLYRRDMQVNRLRKLSRALLTNLLPKDDASSPCLMALLTEILTTSTIEPALEAFSDPDRINQLIISILKTEKRNATASNSNKQRKEYERLKACGNEVLRIKGLYCSIAFGKAKLRSKFVKPESSPLWVETFHFAWKEPSEKEPSGITLDLCGRVMFPKEAFNGCTNLDAIIGRVNVPHNELSSKMHTRTWFPLQSTSAKGGSCGEILLEIQIIDVNELADIDGIPSSATADEVDEKLIQENPLRLDDVLRKNKGFLEFMQFMDDIQAPPFLQFWMNAESFSQTSQKIGPEFIRQDAEMLFKLHLSDESKRKVPIDPTIRGKVWEEINGEHVTSECFVEAQTYVFEVMEWPFFREFRNSDLFRKYCLDQHLSECEQDSQDSALESNGDFLSSGNGVELSNQTPNLSDGESFISTENNDLGNADLTGTAEVQFPVGRPLRRSNSVATFPTLSNDRICDANTDATLNAHLSNQETSKRSRSMSDITTTQSARIHFRRPAIDHNPLTKIEEDSSSQETTEDGGGMKFLTAAITSLREQLVVTEDLIEQTSNKESGKLKSLHHNRDELQRQVNQLVEMARDFAEEEDKHIGVGLIDLKGIVAKVSDASRPASLGPNLVKSLASGKSLVYVIELERTKSSGGWMITRSFADFHHLHTTLREQFPKVDKIKFPSRQRFTSKANNYRLCVELERYLSLLLSDMLLCESKPLQNFLQPDSVIATQSARDRGDGMIEAFRSAANMVKIPFVDPPKAESIRSKPEVQSSTSRRSSSLEPRSSSLELSSSSDELGLARPEPSYNKSGSMSSRLSSLTDESKANNHSDTDHSEVKATKAATSDIDTSKADLHPPRKDTVSNHDSGIAESPRSTSNKDVPSFSSDKPVNSGDETLGTRTPHSQNPSNPKPITEKIALKDLSVEEVDVLIETFFALVEEIFDMADRKQWLRRKALNVLKQILRQSYGKTINRTFLDYLDKSTSQENIVQAIDNVTDTLWPDGTWPQEWPKSRTEDEKQSTKIEAKVRFVNNMPDSILRMVGEYNAVIGATRLFNMLQYKDLTKGLLIKILEAWVRLVFNTSK